MIPPLWMLAAAAAVAYLMWARPAAPVGLPPLSPIADPVGRPLPPPNVRFRGGADPYPAAGGFTPNPFIPWAIVAALLWMHLQDRPAPAPAPAPGPTPVVGLDLRGRFVGPDAAADAATTAALLEELAGWIEYDALPVDNEGRPKEPRLKTGAAFDDLRRAAREGRCRGVSLGARQPAVRDEIKRFLDAEAGTEGGPVDAAARAKWVRAYRAVSQAAAEATR
jgi:hypothetical protein